MSRLNRQEIPVLRRGLSSEVVAAVCKLMSKRTLVGRI